MSLESMNKNELVKELRTAQQDLKLAELKIKELEAKVTTNEVAKSQAEGSLPFQAVSLLRTEDKKFLVIRLGFDLEGRSAITSVVDHKKDYLAYAKAEQILASEIDTQDTLDAGKLLELGNEDN